MEPAYLKTLITELGISQVELSRLLDVTPRTVNLWLTQEKDVPGPVAAYLTLLHALPPVLQLQELSRVRNKGADMSEGMYRFEFAGTDGSSAGVFTLSQGTLFGADAGGVKYDGTYMPSNLPGYVDAKIKLAVPAGVDLVQGVPAQPIPYSFELQCRFASKGNSNISVQTPFGEVVAKIEFMRSLAAA